MQWGSCGNRLWFDARPTRHRSDRRRATRARTASQGSPDDCPDSTRRARRSISVAHASRVTGRSAAGDSPRLASNSAATSARCSGTSVRASSRIPRARPGSGWRRSPPGSGSDRIGSWSGNGPEGSACPRRTGWLTTHIRRSATSTCANPRKTACRYQIFARRVVRDPDGRVRISSRPCISWPAGRRGCVTS